MTAPLSPSLHVDASTCVLRYQNTQPVHCYDIALPCVDFSCFAVASPTSGQLCIAPVTRGRGHTW